MTDTSPRCLLCSSPDIEAWTTAQDAEYLTSMDRFSLYRCRTCDVLFIHPVPLNRLQEIYPANYYSFVSQKKSLARDLKEWLDARMFRRILREIPGTSLRVLDVGGGSGWELNIVRNADARVKVTQVVDMDEGAAGHARANGHEYFCGRIEEYKTTQVFDLALALNLIEHVDDPLTILQKLRSMLAPDGRILIKTPNFRSLDERLFRHHNWAGYHCPRHWVIFTQESLSRLAAQAGLRVVEFSYTQGAPFWSASTLFMLERLGLVSITKERPVMYHPLFAPLGGVFAAFDLLRKPFARTSQMFFVLGHAS